jgi:hypothetical protein
MKKLILLHLMPLLFMVGVLQAQKIINPIPQVIINPIGVTMSLPNSLNHPLINIVNGEGLSEFPSITATHDNNNEANAVTYFNGSNTIDFDLGGNYDVEGLAFWNGIGSGGSNFGVKDILISASQDGINFTLIPGSPTEFAESLAVPALPETFSFDAVSATHIRIVALTNHGEATFTGINEIAFIGTGEATGNIINPASVTTTLVAEFGSNLNNTINGSGLSLFPTLLGTHAATTSANSFIGTKDTGSIDFDLGGSYLVDGLAFWNMHKAITDNASAGIQEVVISSSEDGIDYTPIASAPSTFAEVISTTSPAEKFSFTAVTASFIRFDVMSNYGHPKLVAFAEIAFSGVKTPMIENVINPVAVSTTLSAQFGSIIDNTINGVGLDVLQTLSGNHGGTNPMNAFFATNEAGTIDFDLGGSYLVDGLAFWNANNSFPLPAGVKNVNISSSEDGVTYTAILGAPNVFAAVASNISPAERFSFTEITASFIRFEVITNYGNPDFISFSEVAFSGTALVLNTPSFKLSNAINLYPNPAKDFIRISNNSNLELESITIYDMNGRKVIQHKVKVNSANQTIELSELASGMYMVRVYSNKTHTMKRFIKN